MFTSSQFFVFIKRFLLQVGEFNPAWPSSHLFASCRLPFQGQGLWAQPPSSLFSSGKIQALLWVQQDFSFQDLAVPPSSSKCSSNIKFFLAPQGGVQAGPLSPSSFYHGLFITPIFFECFKTAATQSVSPFLGTNFQTPACTCLLRLLFIRLTLWSVLKGFSSIALNSSAPIWPGHSRLWGPRPLAAMEGLWPSHLIPLA